MDSLPGEDPTLPLGFNGSVNLSQLPDVSGDEIRGRLGGGGVLPDVAEDAISPTRARTMKDFENQIIELRKENFNLKLRIYFLEERMQQKFDGPNEDIYRINIELKVESESLKRDLQERDRLLVKASKALESLAQGGDAEIQRLKEEAHKNVQQVEESLTRRINLLEEELKMAHEEAEKSFATSERERALRLSAEHRLALMTNVPAKDLDLMAALDEKNRQIEQLSLSLKNQEALVQRLEEAKAQMWFSEENSPAEQSQAQAVTLAREKEEELEALRMEFCNQKSDLEKRIQSLQEELGAGEAALSAEKRNALKRDKTIQGLTLALKTKESENEELASEIEGLHASLGKAREVAHKAQLQKYKGAEDSQTLLMEKESLLADLRSENLSKDTENRKLQRRVKRAEQELRELRLEREKLAKELEEALLQKSRSDKTVNDLRNQLEKTQGEMAEKAEALERHYEVLLSEGHQKAQRQEALLARLADSVAQKDQLLQKLDGVVQEKDAELQGWFAKFQNLLKDRELLQMENEDLVKEKNARPDQPLMTKMSPELEETKEAPYDEMLEALRKERDVFSALIKSLREADGINNFQEEMNSIILLRKQLEDDILATGHLRKVLEEQITANKREEESLSSWGDQTSYMSICLRARDYLVLEIDHLSLEELQKKVVELVSVVKELHLENEGLRRKQLELSASGPLAKESQRSLDNSEFLESADTSKTLTEAFEEELNTLSYPCPEILNEVIPSAGSDQHQNLNRHEPEQTESMAGETGGAPESNSRAPLLDEKGPASHGLRPVEPKSASRPLDPRSPTEPDSSCRDRDEVDRKSPTVRPGTEPRKLARGTQSPQPRAQSQPALTGKEELDPVPGPLVDMDAGPSEAEAKEIARQTVTSDGSVARQEEAGSPAASGDRGTPLGLNEESWPRKPAVEGKQPEMPTGAQKAHKSDLCYTVKKSRLPVLLKPSRSTGSISSSTSSQKPDMHLQHRMFDLDETLKGSCVESQLRKDEFPSSGTERGTSEQEGILAGALPGVSPAESLIKLDDTEADVSLSSVGSRDATSAKDESASRGAEPSLELLSSRADASLSRVGSEGDPGSQDPNAGQEGGTDKLEPTRPPRDGQDRARDVPTSREASTATTASLLSLQPAVPSPDAFDCDATDDLKQLRQRIKELRSELAKYHTATDHVVEPPQQPPPGDASTMVQDRGQLPVDDRALLELDHARSQDLSSALRLAADPIRGEDLASRSPEEHHDALVEELRGLLSENEAELEKEQIANMHLLDKVCRLQRRLKGALLEGPGSPAPEDSCQRIRESHSLCVAYRQHLTNLIRAFEELLQASDVDYYLAEGFRERLNQSAQLFEHLEQQCVYGESIEDEMAQLGGLARSLSDSEMSQKSSSSEPPGQNEVAAPDKEEKCPVQPAKFPPELLMEHLHEIRMLRHQLEESIKTNDRLRKQLEQQVRDLEQEPGSAQACIRGVEPRNPRTSEIHFLREQNRLLNVMLAKGSEDRQKENEKLRESLGKKSVTLEHLHQVCELLKKESERLQTQVGKQEEENGRLTHEVYNLRNNLNRLRMELSAAQHQLAEKDHLLHALRVELQVYEKLDGAVGSQKDGSREECWKDRTPPPDFQQLLVEIQAVRAQLEGGAKAVQGVDEQLAEPSSRGKDETGSATVNIGHFSKQGLQPDAGLNDLAFPTADGSILQLQEKDGNCTAPFKADAAPPRDPSDTSSHCSPPASVSQSSSLAGHRCMWADKNGRHVVGSVEDYNSLRKQVTEVRRLFSELQLPGNNGAMDLHPAPLGKVSASVGAIQRNLDETARLLRRLWRVSLPMTVIHGAAYSLQDEGSRAELQRLRRKLAEQEKKLHSTAKRLHSTNRLKENMERVIINQLALTHGVLKKARGNLELQPAENKAFSPSKKSVL